MIIAFCGHSEFFKSDQYKDPVLNILEQTIGDNPAEIYLGGYGGFDEFALQCCKIYKKKHRNVKLVFVAPYLSENNLEFRKQEYDEIFYPNIENYPPRFAIAYCNKYIIQKADFLITYIAHAWGGAYKMYKYAEKQGKEIFNLFEKA